MAADLSQLEDELYAAALKQFASGIRSYTIDGRTVVYNSPGELLDAIRKAQARPATTRPTTGFAEVNT